MLLILTSLFGGKNVTDSCLSFGLSIFFSCLTPNWNSPLGLLNIDEYTFSLCLVPVVTGERKVDDVKTQSSKQFFAKTEPPQQKSVPVKIMVYL